MYSHGFSNLKLPNSDLEPVVVLEAINIVETLGGKETCSDYCCRPQPLGPFKLKTKRCMRFLLDFNGTHEPLPHITSLFVDLNTTQGLVRNTDTVRNTGTMVILSANWKVKLLET